VLGDDDKTEKETVATLLQAGANIDQTNGAGSTALHYAVRMDKLATVKLLVDNSANLNIKDDDGYKAVHHAESTSVALLLTEHNTETTTDERGIVWRLAAREHNNSQLMSTLDSVDINYQGGDYKRTALHWAVRGDDDKTETATVKTVELLLSKGASVDATDKDDYTALHDAVEKDKIETAKVLVANSANMNTKNNRGEKPVHLAKSTSVALFLLQQNEETTTDESKWWTAAAGEHNVNVIAKLLPIVDINYRDVDNKRTALHWAVRGDDDKTEAATVKTVELLLNKGATWDATDKDGRTALHHAVEKDKIETVTLLLDHGIDMTITDKDGKKPLDIATSAAVAKCLIDHGGESITDEDKLIVWRLAAQEQNAEIISSLLFSAIRDEKAIQLNFAFNELNIADKTHLFGPKTENNSPTYLKEEDQFVLMQASNNTVFHYLLTRTRTHTIKSGKVPFHEGTL
jgi:ankyrin repeat protein